MDILKLVFYAVTSLLSLVVTLLIYVYKNDKKQLEEKIENVKNIFNNNVHQTGELLQRVDKALTSLSECVNQMDKDQTLTDKDVENILEKIKDLKGEVDKIKIDLTKLTLDVRLINNRLRFNTNNNSNEY